jgi:hypothetical protein
MIYTLHYRTEKKVCNLMRKVGNFAVCEVCNNIADIMRDGRRNWTQAQREVLKMYRRVHLNQQAGERAVLEKTKHICSELDSRTGQPKALFYFVDGMTESRGDVPRFAAESGRTSKGDQNAKHVTNRVLGCEVVCGLFSKYIFYTTDNMTAAGSNTTIEVIRQLFIDTEQALAQMSMRLPRSLHLQFDNWYVVLLTNYYSSIHNSIIFFVYFLNIIYSGENKNKYLFAYLSMLIELGHFDEIYVRFLIVGHTHSDPDQMFSVLTKKIKSTQFIGSPISFRELLKIAHNNKELRPAVVREINVVYDMKEALKPYINPDIKNYQIPHVFKLFRVCDKAVMQYKQFSTPEERPWLPRLPASTVLPTASSGRIVIEPNAPVGGEAELRDAIVGNTLVRNLNQSQVERVQSLLSGPVTQAIEEVERVSTRQLVERLRAQEEGDQLPPQQPQVSLGDVEAAMTLSSRNDEGYIFWLVTANKPPLADLAPRPVLPKETGAEEVYAVATRMRNFLSLSATGARVTVKSGSPCYDQDYYWYVRQRSLQL